MTISVTTNNGNNTITSGAGADHITVGDGNNTITTGEGADTVTTGNGINTITMGSGAEILSLGAGTNTVTLGVHSTDTADRVTVSGAPATATFVPTATITGLNTNGLDTITFASDGSAGNFTTFTSDQLVTFGNTLHNNVTVGAAPPTLAAAVADVLASWGRPRPAWDRCIPVPWQHLPGRAGLTGSPPVTADTFRCWRTCLSS